MRQQAALARNLPLMTSTGKVPDVYLVPSGLVRRVGDPTWCFVPARRRELCAEFVIGVLQKKARFHLFPRTGSRRDPGMHLTVLRDLRVVCDKLPVGGPVAGKF